MTEIQRTNITDNIRNERLDILAGTRGKKPDHAVRFRDMDALIEAKIAPLRKRIDELEAQVAALTP